MICINLDNTGVGEHDRKIPSLILFLLYSYSLEKMDYSNRNFIKRHVARFKSFVTCSVQGKSILHFTNISGGNGLNEVSPHFAVFFNLS